MRNPWDADIFLSVELAAELIQSRFPDIAFRSIEELGSGWDNSAYLVNSEIVFRFPRRQVAAGLLSAELAVLPQIARFLPLPVPVPHFAAPAGEAFPYPFTGYRLIPGRTACQTEWTREAHRSAAGVLGTFLRALHRVPITAAAPAGGDSISRADMTVRLPVLLDRIHAIDEGLLPLDRPHALRMACSFAEAAPADRSCCVHGDLYARHLLVDGSLSLTGVIDWGDVHAGDCAIDIGGAFSFLPREVWPDFLTAYGHVDEDALQRARFRALNYGVILTQFGVETGDAAIADAGRYAVANVAGD